MQNLEDSDFSTSEDEDDNIDVNIEANIQSQCTIPELERSSHFLAIRITNPDIIQKANQVQKDAILKEEELSDCCMGLGLFHVTLCMLRLEGKEASDELIKLIEEVEPQLKELSENLKLRIEGLDTFGQRVLYAKVLPEPEGEFWQLVR